LKYISTIVVTFPAVRSSVGIVEIALDVFAVDAGTYDFGPPLTSNNSYVIWEVDLRNFKCSNNGDMTSPALVTKIVDLRDGLFPNGLVHLAPGSPYLLVVVSGLGFIWRVNTTTGAYEKWLEDDLMKPQPGTAILAVINRIKLRGSTLYFTNSFRDGGLIARVPISLATGSAIGPYQVFVKNGPNDDFAFAQDGTIYTTTHLGNEVQRVTTAGEVEVVAGGPNSTLVEGSTGAAFGRRAGDKDILLHTWPIKPQWGICALFYEVLFTRTYS
jgi:hypothetical protein